MNAAPLLRHLIEKTGGSVASSLLLVMEGEGLESLPDRIETSTGPYIVARTTTELGLRRLLWAANGAPLIAVVPADLARRLPADLVHGARNQRVQALETGEVLSVLLRRKVQASDEEWFQRLVLDNVDQLVTALDSRTLPTVVTRRDLGELLVDVTLGEALFLYSYMFGPQREEPCPMCSGLMNALSLRIPAIRENIGIAFVARSPLARLVEAKRMLGMPDLPVYSDVSGDYTRAWVSAGDEDVPAMHVFRRDGDGIRHFWSAEMTESDPGQDPRGAPELDPLWTVLDTGPAGRRPDWYPSLNRVGQR